MKNMFGVIDQGTTSTRFIIFDEKQNILGSAQKEHHQIHPQNGWVEHDPEQIWQNVLELINRTITKLKISLSDLTSIGITNQRETIVAWDYKTGKPYYNAIVWQDLRGSEFCTKLEDQYTNQFFADLTGLRASPYFSASKISWLLDHIKDHNNLKLGTIDSWLLWKLTGEHITDITNASRTLLFDINTCSWSLPLCKIFGVDINTLPKVLPSISKQYPKAKINGVKIPIYAVMGDQQAALFGQSCFKYGEMKVTYGTGCFLLANTENQLIKDPNLLTTIGYQLDNQPPQYALEGSVAVGGSLLQWLRDDLQLFSNVKEIDTLANSVDDTADCYIVPAFSGLFAPYWKSDARGCFVGLTRSVKKPHVAKAALEAIAFQVNDLISTFEKCFNLKIPQIYVDGGLVNSKPLMQIQADISDIKIVCPKFTETTAFGIAIASQIAIGMIDFNFKQDIDRHWDPDPMFLLRDEKVKSWNKAISKSLDWV